MDQYLLIPFLWGWTSIYQLFWCSPGVQGFDTLPEVNQWKWGTLGATAARNFTTDSLGIRTAALHLPEDVDETFRNHLVDPRSWPKKKMEKIWLTKVWYPTWPIPNQKSLPIPIPIKTKIALWFFGVWEEDTPAVRPETESAQHEHVNLEQRPKQITVMDLYCTSNA